MKTLPATFRLILALLILSFSGAICYCQNPAGAPEGVVRDSGTLKVADLRFDNFLGIVSANLEVRAGDEAGLKFFLEGYSRDEDKDDAGRPVYRVHLSYVIDITDPEGKPLQPETEGRIQTLLGTQDDGWRPSVEWSVRVPSTAPSGKYPIRIRVTDHIGEQAIEYSAGLRVRGEALKTSGRFEVIEVEFAPSDRGPWRPIWYFELWSPVYVRYKIAGFTVAPDRQISVEQDWAVIDAEGQEVISKLAAMVEESRGFYPPRFIQSFFSISLREPQPGDYRVRIDARDNLGNQLATAEGRFVLRP